MKEWLKQQKYHLLLILILLCLAGVLEGIVSFYFEELRRHPIKISRLVQIYPIYNRDGTWFHGKIGIGYIGWLLYLETILSLGLLTVMMRYMDLWICFFGLNRKWLYIVDIGIVPALYRMLTRIRGSYTLDYLQVKRMVYDFPDICIGFFVAGVLIWAIRVSLISHSYIHKMRAGMGFSERMIWTIRFRRMFFRVFFLPKAQWESEFEQWGRVSCTKV